MPLTLTEFQVRKRLPKRAGLRDLYDAACLLEWTSIKAIAELAEVSYARARVELAELVKDGWLTLERRGSVTRGEVRYVPRIGVAIAIARDRNPEADCDRPRSHRAIARDRNPLEDRARVGSGSGSLGRSKTLPSVRLEGVQGETDGRTDGGDELAEHQNALTERVCREWARWAVTPTVAYHGIHRLLNARLTARELNKFLVDALSGKHPAFGGVDDAFRWGQSTCDDRIRLWVNIERASREVGLAKAPREHDERPSLEEREAAQERRAAAGAAAAERLKQLTKLR